MALDFGKELGAEERASAQRLTLYLPDKDKHGRPISDLASWLKEARGLLSQIGGGSTALPPADGTWVNDEAQLVWEETRIVYCFVHTEKLVARLPELREFLHRFGRQTNQGEVVAEFDGWFHRIKQFDPPSGG